MKYSFFGIIFLSSLLVVYSQKVEVTATTNKKEVDSILKKEREEARINRAFFAEDDKCRSLVRTREWIKAEASCRVAISLVEKLPKEHVLERSSARVSLAITLLWLRRSEEAISLLNKSLEIGKPILDDSDAETGDRYFLLGQAYNVVGNVDEAVRYYARAESTYRTAFKEIGDNDLRQVYAKSIVSTLEAHLELLESDDRADLVALLEKQLAGAKIEFAEFFKP